MQYGFGFPLKWAIPQSLLGINSLDHLALALQAHFLFDSTPS
jgi:hypothetical protein